VIENQFNIIIGESNIGRSEFLYQISNRLNQLGYNICIVSGDGSGSDGGPVPLIERDILHLLNKNDVRLYKMMNESNLDIILIDDICYLSDDCLSEVINTDKIIISNCLMYRNIIGFRSTPRKTFTPVILNDMIKKSDIFKLTKTTIEYNNSIIDRNDFLDNFLKQLKRDLKINSLLDDKQC
jgi:hypothetical protein